MNEGKLPYSRTSWTMKRAAKAVNVEGRTNEDWSFLRASLDSLLDRELLFVYNKK